MKILDLFKKKKKIEIVVEKPTPKLFKTIVPQSYLDKNIIWDKHLAAENIIIIQD